MTDIKIKELTLENFKAQNRHVTFGDNENRISGFNSAGKSTLMQSWFWLISGTCGADTVANQDLFDNTKEITPETPKAVVTAVIELDGETYKLQRSAEAAFQRKRGTNDVVKSASDNYEYYIDDISRSATDYRIWLNEHIATEDMLRFALDGSFFISSIFDDKRKARQVIEKLVGTVTRDEMKGNYADIDDLLKKFTPEEIEERCKNLIKGLDTRLTEIPTLIQNKETEISEIEQTDFGAVDKEITDLEKEREDLDKQMTDLSERVKPQMEAKHNAEREKQMKQDVYNKAYYDWKASFDKKRDDLTSEINAIRRQNDKSKQMHDDALIRQRNATTERDRLQKLLDNATSKRARLLKERDEEKARTFDVAAAICPFCGTLLEGEKLHEQIAKFGHNKREAIDRIVAEGKATAEEIKHLEEQIKQQEDIIAQPLPEVITQSTDDLDKKALDLANADTSKDAFDKTEQAQTLLADIEAVVIPEVIMPDNSTIVAAKKDVNDKLTPLYERRGLKSRLQSLKDSIATLRAEQKEKGAEMAKYERQRQLVQAFKQEQTEILSHKVNDGLKYSQLSVWSQQKDGTTVPDLVLKNAQGVSYATANGASRLVTAIDVQRLFCEKLGVNMPTWVDEASIINANNLPKLPDTQMFYLFCADTPLNIESF